MTYKKDNSGGYGNPPVDGQIKPGERRSPGRPKGSTTMAGELRRMFNSKTLMAVNGRTKSVPTTRAFAERVKKVGLTGSEKALWNTIDLAIKFGPQEEAMTEESFNLDLSGFTDGEFALFADFLRRSGMPHAYGAEPTTGKQFRPGDDVGDTPMDTRGEES